MRRDRSTIVDTAYVGADELHRLMTLRDLTDPAQGPHAMQQLLDEVVTALTRVWGCTTTTVRTPALVSVRDNYDRLGFACAHVARDARYTRYVSPSVMLRSHTSADVPHALERYARQQGPVDELLVLPGLVYRRDVVDRTHVGEPHQLDLWRVRSAPDLDHADLEQMVATVVEAVLPGAEYRTVPAVHPYTRGGRQVDVRHDGRWLELAECGPAARGVLDGAGLAGSQWSGLALGMGLERALMIRKRIPDIRFLRSNDRRIAAQLHDLDPWQPVSMLPATTRDLSVVLDEATDDETLGDTVRTALADRICDVESIEVLTRTAHDRLPHRAQRRLGTRPGQVNALVRLTLRPLERTLTSQQANEIRNDVYVALHTGPHRELA
jgi:phenylalanyl-tRNA synthetase alpha chain